MNIFSRSCKRNTTSKKKPSDFKKGEVYRMAVASRSHVTEPYHVIINDVGNDFIETYVPDKHSLRIEYPSLQWDYQIPRMTFVNGDFNAIQKPTES